MIRLIDADMLLKIAHDYMLRKQEEGATETFTLDEVEVLVRTAPTVLSLGIDLAKDIQQGVPASMSIIHDYEQIEEATEE